MTETILPSHDENEWAFVEEQLGRPWNSPEDFINSVVFFTSKDFEDSSAVYQVLMYGELPFEDPTLLTRRIFPTIQKYAMMMPKLFPTGIIYPLLSGSNGKVELSKAQICCLLAHMTVCTIERPSWFSNESDHDFRCWLSSELPSSVAYLKCLLLYFKSVSEGIIDMGSTVTFSRHVVQQNETPDWNSSEKDLVGLNIRLYGDIGECMEESEVDAANKNVGFGKTGSQEEILLGMSPESCAVVYFLPTLANNETGKITGVAKIGTYKGYRMDLELTGRTNEEEIRNCQKRTILSIDAAEYDSHSSKLVSLKDQYSTVKFERDLLKAYCGYSSSDNKLISSIAFWGCGSFAGDPYLKLIIMWIAASEAEVKELTLCANGNEEYSEFAQNFISKARNNAWKVKDLVALVDGYRNKLEGASDVPEGNILE